MVYRNWGEGYEGSLNENCITLGEALKSAGYATFMSGKWHVAAHNDPPAHSLPENRGFDRSTAVRTHIDSYWKVLAGCDIYRDGKILNEGDNEKTNLRDPYKPDQDFYTTNFFTDVAIEYMEDTLRTDEKPFFLAVGFHKPHLPFVAPERFFQSYPMDEIQLPKDQNPQDP